MWSELWSSIWVTLFLSVLRPMIKWVLRSVTGKCELLRITYEENPGCRRTRRIEKCLELSKRPILKRITQSSDIDIDETVQEVIQIKEIVVDVHSQFTCRFESCIKQILGYRHLIDEVEQERKIPYSSDNKQHEDLLLQLWQLLMPDTKLESRVTKQWTDIGFQGDDPKTDFRGMGVLGLKQLVYFSEKHGKESSQVLSLSHHPQYGYSYAIVGINLTSMIYDHLRKGYLKTHFYNKTQQAPTLQDFHELYCYIFQEFNKFWFSEKPKDIMEFGRLRDKFDKQIIHRLTNLDTVFK